MKKKMLVLVIVLSALLLTTSVALADKPTDFNGQGDVVSQMEEHGFNEWGYNYTAHLFSGCWANYTKGANGGPFDDPKCADQAANGLGDDYLIMKWNDAWLTVDGKRPVPYEGSGAWLTNEWRWTASNGKKATNFIKIVAKDYVGQDCSEMGGEEIWGAFCIVQEVLNDPDSGAHGINLLGDPGLNQWFSLNPQN